MIVADVSSHEPDEMTCAENHDVLKELATAAADPPLRGSVLPWAAKRNRRPILIGVSGAWGVGKSSMIKLVRKALAERTAEGQPFRIRFC